MERTLCVKKFVKRCFTIGGAPWAKPKRLARQPNPSRKRGTGSSKERGKKGTENGKNKNQHKGRETAKKSLVRRWNGNPTQGTLAGDRNLT